MVVNNPSAKIRVMADLSHLDEKYFIDLNVYNCPFCKRGAVKYLIVDSTSFDWSNDKTCTLFIVQCGEPSCGKKSLHLTFFPISVFGTPSSRKFYLEYSVRESIPDWESRLDEFIFYSQPTSFFTLDNRIPKLVRELITESDNCLKMNLLVGASAALRKSIYELIRTEDAIVKNEKTGLTDYSESIKKLKGKFSRVQEELFDALGNVKDMASDVVHESSWEQWDSSKLRSLIELVRAVLHEMYVVPDEQKKRVGVVADLKNLFSKGKDSESGS